MKKNKKLLSLVLSVMLVISLVPAAVFAATITETDHLTPGADIDSLSLSVTGYTSTRIDETYIALGYTNTRYTYNITLPASTADNAQLTITFSPTAGTGTVVSTISAGGPIQYFGPMINNNASNTQTVTLSNGTGSKTVYVHRGLGLTPPVYGKYDTYIFNFEKGYPVSISTGDPVYIQWNTSAPTTGTVVRRVAGSALPTDFTLWVDNPGNSYQITQTYTPDGQTTPVTDTISADYNDGTNYAYTVPFQNVESTVTAISGGVTYTITLEARPDEQGAAQGSAPSAIVSYLPIGQYATGGNWGTINKGTAQNPVYKFVGASGLESTGVSLGALGGYIEFYFANGIQDTSTNPYGVDFVVYGNAFEGNPEPGAVQVSENGTVWYELAGSKYYSGSFSYVGTQVADKFSNAYTGTLQNADITYTIDSGNINTQLKDGSGASKFSTKFTSGTGWWPLTSEGYLMGQTYTDWNNNTHTAPTPHTDTNVTVSHSDSALTFGGVTAIQDSNTNSDYAFGYADVTPNGSPANYGAPVNPYTPDTGNKTGGDGFDLAWAVDITTGEPVSVSGKTFHYVRVYSAVLDNATFGETSPEVCGIFTTYGSESGNTTTSVSQATLTVPGHSNATLSTNPSSIPSYTVTSNTNITITYELSGNYIFVNGVSGTGTASAVVNVAPGETKIVRVVVQDGTTKLPYIGYLKLVGSSGGGGGD